MSRILPKLMRRVKGRLISSRARQDSTKALIRLTSGTLIAMAEQASRTMAIVPRQRRDDCRSWRDIKRALELDHQLRLALIVRYAAVAYDNHNRFTAQHF